MLRLINKYLTLDNLLFVGVFGLTLLLKIHFFPVISPDYSSFLEPWSKTLEEKGFAAFKERFYDYTPSYLYILWLGTVLKINSLIWIKCISLIFELIISFYSAKIVSIWAPKLFQYVFLIIFILPAVVFNGSWWGQCDVIYSSLVIASLYYLLIATREVPKDNAKIANPITPAQRYEFVPSHEQKFITKSKSNYLVRLSFLLFAIAISFKLQAIFFAPVIGLLFITLNFNWKRMVELLTIIITTYIVAILPAFFAGRPLLDTNETIKDGLLTIYLTQSGTYQNLVMGAIPSFYQWIDNDKYPYFYFGGVVFTLITFLFFALIISKSQVKNLSRKMILKISLISTLIVPFLLPKMHERYMFLAEILAVIYSFVFPKKFWVGIFITIISFGIYVSGTIGGPIPDFMRREYTPLWVIFILVFLVQDIIRNKDS